MTEISSTALASLDAEGRLQSPVYKGPIGPGLYGFRGELALKFAEKLSDEARPPEIKLDQAMLVAPAGSATISFLAGFSTALANLRTLCEVLQDKLAPGGVYYFFAGNLDISRRYQIAFGGAEFRVLPLDEATVYNELLELFRIDKSELKRLDTAGKLAVIARGAAGYAEAWPRIGFDEAVAAAGPVKVRENRPV